MKIRPIDELGSATYTGEAKNLQALHFLRR